MGQFRGRWPALRRDRSVAGDLGDAWNRGLEPYIEDVARCAAKAGYLAFGSDGLSPLGGYPGTDEEGRDMQRSLDREKLIEDFFAAFGVFAGS